MAEGAGACAGPPLLFYLRIERARGLGDPLQWTETLPRAARHTSLKNIYGSCGSSVDEVRWNRTDVVEVAAARQHWPQLPLPSPSNNRPQKKKPPSKERRVGYYKTGYNMAAPRAGLLP